VAHFQHGVLHVCELASLAEVGDGERVEPARRGGPRAESSRTARRISSNRSRRVYTGRRCGAAVGRHVAGELCRSCTQMDVALCLKGSHTVTNFRSSPPPRTPLLVQCRLPVCRRGRSSIVAQGDMRPLRLFMLRCHHACSRGRTTSSRSASSHPRRPWCSTLTRWWLPRSRRPVFDFLYSGSTSWPTLPRVAASTKEGVGR
jgi:hypothetical protein